MASIRMRITASYAFAFAGTMFAFSAVVWAERRELAQLDLRDRAATSADIGTRILSQTGVTNEPLTIKTRRGTGAGDDSATVTPDSLGREIGPRYKALLDALPGFLIIGDATHAVYMSPAGRALSARDSATLADAAFRLTAKADSLVDLEDGPAQLLLVARFDSTTSPVRRVVAGLSTEPIDVAGAQVLFFSLVVAPIILLISAVTAWTLAGRLLSPIERMVNDVEAISAGRSLPRRVPVEDWEEEMGRRGTTLNGLMGPLETSFAAPPRFPADASHELKTPLTVLRADIERAMTTPQGGTEQLVALEEGLQKTGAF